MRGSVCSVYFFFQAEDGIRDLVRSRGLGDVYKRQTSAWVFSIPATSGSEGLRCRASKTITSTFPTLKLSLIHI